MIADNDTPSWLVGMLAKRPLEALMGLCRLIQVGLRNGR